MGYFIAIGLFLASMVFKDDESSEILLVLGWLVLAFTFIAS